MQAQKRHLESRAIGARQTLAYGLGRALIEARSLKGMLALPARLRRLRLRQNAKRKLRVPDTVPGDVAQRMRLVDETLDRADSEGIAATESWLENETDPARRGRALVELALFAIEQGAGEASAVGQRAAEFAPGEPRLLTLVARLQAAGEVVAPARIGRLIAGRQPLSAPQRAWLESLERDAAWLKGERPAGALPDRDTSAAGSITGLALLAPDNWRSHPRILTAEAAGRSAGLNVIFGLPDAPSAEWAAHIFPDSLDFAEQAMTQCAKVGAVLLDLDNPPEALCGSVASEAAGASKIRLEYMVAVADRVIMRGPAAAGLIEPLGGTGRVVEDIWPDIVPISEKDTAVARTEFGLGEGKTLAIAADLGDENGVDRLLPLLGELLQDDTISQVAILGRGAAAPRLAQLAAEYGLDDRVTFLGSPSFERWPELFSCFDAILFPSRRMESLGSPIPLAMTLAAQLGIPALHGEAALQSRTSDAVHRSILGEDKKTAIVQALAASAEPTSPGPSEALKGLYEELRKG